MEDQDDQPSDHSPYGANKHGDDVDGNRRRNEEVRQKEEYYSYEGVDDESSQLPSPSPPQEEQGRQHQNDDEYRRFHGALAYPRPPLRAQTKRAGTHEVGPRPRMLRNEEGGSLFYGDPPSGSRRPRRESALISP